MNYQEAVETLLVALAKVEHAGFSVDVNLAGDYIQITDEDGENAYVYDLRFDAEADECVWWALPVEALA